MYLPEAFRINDEAMLHEFIRAHSFGELITARNSHPQLSAIPWVFKDGALQGHLARANPQVAHIEDGTPALAVFNGAHAFVSSTCYEPASGIATWNYLSVHIHGILKPMDDESALWEHLDALTQQHEPAERLDELHAAARKKTACCNTSSALSCTSNRWKANSNSVKTAPRMTASASSATWKAATTSRLTP